MRFRYYEDLKKLARSVRQEHGLQGPRVLKSDLKKIFKANGIKLDYWPYRLKGLRGAYFNDEYGTSIMISKELPDDPMVFTMAHELKHHLTDSEVGQVNCLAKDVSAPIEIGAEVFAAEFLFPEEIFRKLMSELGVSDGKCQPEHLVRLKCETKTTLSYTGLVKRAEWLGFAAKGSLPQNGWKRLEEEIYGVPIYKQLSIARRRGSLRASD